MSIKFRKNGISKNLNRVSEVETGFIKFINVNQHGKKKVK